MKLRVLLSALIIFSFSCTAKDSTENDLINAMQTYLYKTINNDSSNVKYHVEKVIYFNDKNKYICEFTVRLKTKLFDTTGIMKANVSKDLKKIDRIY